MTTEMTTTDGNVPSIHAAPHVHVDHAVQKANICSDIIKKQGLSSRIGLGDHVNVEGWQLLATMMGVSTREENVTEVKPGVFEATVRAFRIGGEDLGSATGRCGDPDDGRWAKSPTHAKRSMAITRATVRALKKDLGWVMKLAGYSGTPLEDMPDRLQQTKGKTQAVVYTGAKEQQTWVLGICKKEGLPEEQWEQVHEKLLNGPLDAPAVLKIIASLKSY